MIIKNEKLNEIYKRAKLNGWDCEYEEEYYPSSHYDERSEDYMKFCGEKLELFKSNEESSKSENYSNIQIFTMKENYVGIDYRCNYIYFAEGETILFNVDLILSRISNFHNDMKDWIMKNKYEEIRKAILENQGEHYTVSECWDDSNTLVLIVQDNYDKENLNFLKAVTGNHVDVHNCDALDNFLCKVFSPKKCYSQDATWSNCDECRKAVHEDNLIHIFSIGENGGWDEYVCPKCSVKTEKDDE